MSENMVKTTLADASQSAPPAEDVQDVHLPELHELGRPVPTRAQIAMAIAACLRAYNGTEIVIQSTSDNFLSALRDIVGEDPVIPPNRVIQRIAIETMGDAWVVQSPLIGTGIAIGPSPAAIERTWFA